MRTMTRIAGTALLLTALVLFFGQPTYAVTLLAADQNGNLISVETDTAAGTFIGQETMYPLSTEIEFDAANQILYSDEFYGFTNLHSIDTATGLSTGFVPHNCCAYTGMEFVGSTLYVTNIDPGLAPGEAYDPEDLNGAPIYLDVVDPTTGNSIRIGSTGGSPPITGLAYDVNSETMYGVTGGNSGGGGGAEGSDDPTQLVTVNLDTGIVTPLFPLTEVTGGTLRAVGSIEFGSDGVLYGGMGRAGSPNPGWLFSIDVDTGVVTYIGFPGLPGITGLTNPEGDAAPPDLARFLVSKDFSDDNEAEVQVTLTCNTGLPLMQPATISEGDPVNFVIGDFEQGELNCEVVESVPDGYTAAYDNGTVVSGESCTWTQLTGGQYSCVIDNDLDEVEIEVTKVWIDENPQFSASNVAEATWSCRNVADPCDGFSCNSSGRLDFNGNPDSDSFYVLPDWDEGTSCSVTEVNVFDGGVEIDDSECQSLLVFPGTGASCTIYNTRLYAGIPTLNQYGLGILALIMLGMGFVAFRRVL